MTSSAGDGGAADVAAIWARFQEEGAASLEAWIGAERELAEARQKGLEDFHAGDRLMVAEATLQTAIVDYAANQPGVENATALATEILRFAEAMLAKKL